MQLYMKQKVFSLRTRFDIFDAAEMPVYHVEGEFSFGTRLHIADSHGNELAMIRQKLWTFRPRYELEVFGQPPAMLVQYFALFKTRFEIEGWGWSAEGNFTGHEFVIADEEGPLMTVSKEWFTWGDSYVLDIADRVDPVGCVCAMLAIDMVIAAANRSSAASH